MALSFQKFISEVFVNGKFPKFLPSENFPLYGIQNIERLYRQKYGITWERMDVIGPVV